MSYKIFVDCTMHLGDIMIASSIFPILKKHHPDAEITFLTQAALAPAASLIEGVDHVIPYQYKSGGSMLGVWQMAKILRKEHFDLGISIEPRKRVTFMKWLAGIPVRISLLQAIGEKKLGGERYFYTHDIKLDGWNLFAHRRSESFQEAMKRYFHDDDPTYYPPHLKPSTPKDFETIDRILADVSHQAPVIALCVQRAVSRPDEWPAERFSELFDRMADEYHATFVITGVESQRQRAEEIINGTHHRDCFVDMIGKTSLRELVALLRRVDVLVTVDTGIAHLAGAAGCPVLSVVTSSWPKIFCASGEHCRVASAQVSCIGRPMCHIAETCQDCRCCSQLTVDMVMEEFKKLWCELRK